MTALYPLSPAVCAVADGEHEGGVQGCDRDVQPDARRGAGVRWAEQARQRGRGLRGAVPSRQHQSVTLLVSFRNSRFASGRVGVPHKLVHCMNMLRAI